jgi:hypothetical protein
MARHSIGNPKQSQLQRKFPRFPMMLRKVHVEPVNSPAMLCPPVAPVERHRGGFRGGRGHRPSGGQARCQINGITGSAYDDTLTGIAIGHSRMGAGRAMTADHGENCDLQTILAFTSTAPGVTRSKTSWHSNQNSH